MLASKKGFFWRVLSLWACLSLVTMYLRFGHASVLWACFFLWGCLLLRVCLCLAGVLLVRRSLLEGVGLSCGRASVLGPCPCLVGVSEQNNGAKLCPFILRFFSQKMFVSLKKKNRGAECWSADEVICGTFFGLLEDASLWIAVINSLKSHLAFRKKTTALPWIIY